ncbi:MAG: hypothetical protein R3C51_01395 [Parvularculaceae bacterium]
MGTPSKTLTFEDATVVWLKRWNGLYQHEIASELECNQGRISEILSEKAHQGSRVEAMRRRGAFE